MHRRSKVKLQQRKIRAIIFGSAFRDFRLAETISRTSRVDVLGELQEAVDVSLIPDLEKGEVLSDSRGLGSFQR